MSLSIAQHLDYVQRLLEKSREAHGSPAAKRALEKMPLHEWQAKAFSQLFLAIQEDVQYVAALEEDKTASEIASEPSDHDKALGDLLNQATRISPGHLANLPQELIDQLQISDADRFQWDVVELIDRTPDKTISIDVLLIALYRTTGKVHDRTDLSNRIWRLTRKGIVFAVQGKKGIYTTVPQSGELELAAPDEGEDLA
jgi:hypothetical protein